MRGFQSKHVSTVSSARETSVKLSNLSNEVSIVDVVDTHSKSHEQPSNAPRPSDFAAGKLEHHFDDFTLTAGMHVSSGVKSQDQDVVVDCVPAMKFVSEAFPSSHNAAQVEENQTQTRRDEVFSSPQMQSQLTGDVGDATDAASPQNPDHVIAESITADGDAPTISVNSHVPVGVIILQGSYLYS